MQVIEVIASMIALTSAAIGLMTGSMTKEIESIPDLTSGQSVRLMRVVISVHKDSIARATGPISDWIGKENVRISVWTIRATE
jgi:hypothetical protein